MNIEDEVKSTHPYSLAKKVKLNLLFTRNILVEHFQEILKPFDLSDEQFNVLRILRGQKGKPINMSSIQERMLTKNSNTTRLIDKLIDKEMVVRKICPKNRRKMEITITEKGLSVLTKLDPMVDNHLQTFSEKLTEKELETLNILLEKLRTE
ncbi:MarR family winged helix-turn-helix transcriptional regulator [Flavobacterium sp.]|uniref:MarR family winged helix-turn-helix transcriptional regulator n=1 Tax=Flavobacterium sp. TaxID=239 RepID=UPI003529CEBD